MGTGSFPGVKYGQGVLLTTHPLLVPWSWKSRAIPVPTLWATTGPVMGTLYLYLLCCKTNRGWFYCFCKELTFVVVAEHVCSCTHLKNNNLCAVICFYVYIYLFICVELLLVWHILTHFCDVCFLFPLYCHCVPPFIFMFLEQYFLIYCVATGYFCLVWCRFQEVCGSSCSFETRIPCAGYLRDFQWQYYSLILILYKFCAMSFCCFYCLWWQNCFDYLWLCISCSVWYCLCVCLFLAWQPPPPLGQGLLIHEVSRWHMTTHHSR
jgi:hypothetical protein